MESTIRTGRYTTSTFTNDLFLIFYFSLSSTVLLQSIGDIIEAASKWDSVESAINDLKQYETLRVSKLVLVLFMNTLSHNLESLYLIYLVVLNLEIIPES